MQWSKKGNTFEGQLGRSKERERIEYEERGGMKRKESERERGKKRNRKRETSEEGGREKREGGRRKFLWGIVFRISFLRDVANSQ